MNFKDLQMDVFSELKWTQDGSDLLWSSCLTK